MKTILINDFPLFWRWTDLKYCQFSEKELSKIQPLVADTAKQYYKKISSLLENNDFSPSKNIFNKIEYIDNYQFEEVKNWLKTRITQKEIILSWFEDIAIIVDVNLFISKWDDFCYPSSDDIIIYSEDKDWIILYHHSEVFWYGEK